MRRPNGVTGTHIILAIVIGTVLIAGMVIMSWQSVREHEIDAEINAQTEIEKTAIEEKAATQRTRERMHWNPWYSDDKNESDATIENEKGKSE